MRNHFIVWLICSCMFCLKIYAQDSLKLHSPDGFLEFCILINGNGIPQYSVQYKHKEIVLPSVLGIAGWSSKLSLKSVQVFSENKTWKPVYGERSIVRDEYNQTKFQFVRSDKDRQPLMLEVRAYNEGIAFRYSFPENPAGGTDIVISKEFTEFTMPADTKAWFTDHAQGQYKLLALNNWPGEAERPLTLQLSNGAYISLAEAGVVDYCRTKFVLNNQVPNTIACSMFDKVELTTPFATPWRVIMVAEKATQLLQNNDIILNLNESCRISNTEWIKPGKIIREISLSTDGAKQLVDFAVKRHLQYIHFDAGWYGFEYASSSDASAVNVDPRRNPKNDLDLKEVIRYAKERGIGVFLYVNQRALANQLDTLLPLYEKWGVAGIKFGFVHVGSHRWTTWLHDAVKKCAQHHLMVDIHDEYRPTGFSRTYPNLLTQEGVRGNEEMPEATNSTIIPFTRLLTGAADHTICYYHRPELKKRLAETKNARVMKTTSGHQLALAVIMYSPLQFLYWYDKPDDSQNEPELEFFDHVPTVWDDTKILAGEIGEYISVARRSSNEWFAAVITNNNARTVDFSFSFLPQGKKFKAKIYVDDQKSPVRTHVSINTVVVTSETVLKCSLPSSGGTAIWISPL